MKIKNILLTAITALSIFTLGTTSAYAITKESNATSNKCSQVATNSLKPNQAELYYMYSNETGHYLLDSSAEFESVIYVSNEDFMFTQDMYHHGKKFIGTFADDALWELTGLEVVSK